MSVEHAIEWKHLPQAVQWSLRASRCSIQEQVDLPHREAGLTVLDGRAHPILELLEFAEPTLAPAPEASR